MTRSWDEIVQELGGLGRRHDADAWRIGELVYEAVQVGPPGVRSRAGDRIAALAAALPYWLPGTLDTYRKTWWNYWNTATATLDVVPGVCFGAHQAVMGRQDRLELLQSLVDDVGDPGRVTVAMAKTAARERARIDRQIDYAARLEVLDVYWPQLRSLDEAAYWMRTTRLWIERAGLAQSPEQREEIQLRSDTAVIEADRLHTTVHDPNTPIAPKVVESGLTAQIEAEARRLHHEDEP